MTSIFETLSSLCVASLETREVYATSTRDREGLTVYRDRQSGVIYIDGFYAGDEIYEEGDYRQVNLTKTGSRDYEIVSDVARRSGAYRPFITGKDIVDFGCGDGILLRAIKNEVQSCCGVELQKDYVSALEADGIPCHTSLEALSGNSWDSALSFHVIEHLPEPIPVLKEFHRILKPGGMAVIEVPHAGDFLLAQAECDAFKKFTLWSQHLVLHTRESLRRLIAAAGFTDIVVEGVQRYPLSNHIQWLGQGRPGGHKSKFASLDTPALVEAYTAALRKIDATDTLVAIARKPA